MFSSCFAFPNIRYAGGIASLSRNRSLTPPPPMLHHTVLPLLFQVPLVSAERNRTSGSGGNKGKAAQPNSGGEGGAAQEEEGLLDRPLWSYMSDRITRLLREGLGDRCVLARPLCGVSGEAGEDFRGERDRILLYLYTLVFSKSAHTAVLPFSLKDIFFVRFYRTGMVLR